jgi:acetyltransferase EpsM
MILPRGAPRPGTELIVVVGAGGHGKVVADALCLMLGHPIDGFIDCNEALEGSRVLGLRVLGGHEWLMREAGQRSVAVALGVGDETDRQRLMRKFTKHEIQILTVIHPRATVAKSASVGSGTVVLAAAVLNADARVGEGTIINTAAVVEHDVEIGDFTHVSPNATTGGAIRIGSCCHIGLGAQILPGVSIGSGTIVGAGAVVLNDLPANVVAAGNPARILRSRADAAHEDSPVKQRATKLSVARRREIP